MSGSNLLSYSGAFGVPTDPDNTLSPFTLPDYVPSQPAAATPTATSTRPTAPMITPFTAKNLPEGISPDEDLLVRTIYGEAAGESPTGQRAVAAVIRNRMADSGLDTAGVVFGPNQFEPWNNPKTRAHLEGLDPGSPEYQKILTNIRADTSDPTGGATHFYSPKTQEALNRAPPSWGNAEPSAVIGGHNFYRIGFKPGSGAPGAAPGAPVQVAAAPTAAAPMVAATAPTAPLNRLSSLPNGANFAAMTPQQKLAYLQQLRSLFGTGHTQMAAAGGGGQMVGGVNDAIPLQAGRSA